MWAIDRQLYFMQVVDGECQIRTIILEKNSVGVLFYAERSVLLILTQYLPLSSWAPELGLHN